MIKETMTCEERLLAAVHLKPYDRVPVVPLIGQWVVQYKKLPRGLRYKDPARLLQAFKDVCTELGGYDAQYVPGFGWPRGSWHISSAAGNMVAAGKRGILENFSAQYDEQESLHIDDYDKIIARGWNGFCEEYFPRAMGVSLEQLDKATKDALKTYKEDAEGWKAMGIPTMTGALVISCEMTLSLGRTLPNFMMDIHRYPDKVLAAMEAMVPDFIQNALDDVKASGFPWVNISLERGSGAYFNLKTYEKFFFPQLKKIVDALTAKGNIVVMHMDTNWTLNMPYLKELPKGKCIVETDSTTDIFKAKEILNGHLCLMGDVPASMTSLGVPEDTTSYCKKLIDIVGKDGGFILSTGCECPVDSKFENMKALCDAAKTFPYPRSRQPRN